MTQKIIVLVRDRQDEKHGEISVLDDPEKAERLVEALLEAGFEPDRIQVFMGQTSEFQVSHRPVVALRDGEGETPETGQAAALDVKVPDEVATASQEQTPEEETVAAELQQEPSESHPPVFKRDDETTTDEPKEEPTEAEEGESQEEEAEAEPVRFSSLFRSA